MRIRAVVAAVATSLLIVPTAAADATTPTLSAEGTGSVMVRPDRASLAISVRRSAPQSSAALSAANRTTRKIVRAVRAAGVPAAGIQTQNVGVTRQTLHVGPEGHKHLVRRYVADQELDVDCPVSVVGHVIDVATGAGAAGIDGPAFSFSDPSAGATAAEQAALADARRQADAAAARLGYVVTGVQSVVLNPSEDTGSGSSGSAGAPTAKSAPTRVHPGRQEVDATVRVVYTIAPAASG